MRSSASVISRSSRDVLQCRVGILCVRCDHGDHSRGSVLGRMNFTAWVIFCPVWMTLVYTVGAFRPLGGGWLSQLGVQDFSGGYVIHLAAGTSGFVAAAVVGHAYGQIESNSRPTAYW